MRFPNNTRRSRDSQSVHGTSDTPTVAVQDMRHLPDQMVRDAAQGLERINRRAAVLRMESIKRILDSEEPEYASCRQEASSTL